MAMILLIQTDAGNPVTWHYDHLADLNVRTHNPVNWNYDQLADLNVCAHNPVNCHCDHLFTRELSKLFSILFAKYVNFYYIPLIPDYFIYFRLYLLILLCFTSAKTCKIFLLICL